MAETGRANALAARMAAVASEPPGYAEVRRIVALPVRRRLEPEEVAALSEREVTPEARVEGFTLWREQAEALLAFEAESGAFLPLAVGKGKSFIGLLCARSAFRRRAVRRVLYLLPRRAVVEFLGRHVRGARRTFGFDVPVHNLTGLDVERREKLAASGRSGIYAFPYSLLSEDDASVMLEAIDPDLVIADEAHRLASARPSAKKGRFWAMMKRRRRMLVSLSGTMSRKRILDFAALMIESLGESAPIPRESAEVELWGQVLDAGSPAPEQQHRDLLNPVLEWAVEQVRLGKISAQQADGPLVPDGRGYRRAFRLRRDTAPGVVSSSEEQLGVSLAIENMPAPCLSTSLSVEALEKATASWADLCPPGEADAPAPADAFRHLPPLERMHALLWAVETCWRTPSGDEVEYAIHGFKWRYEISAGFYNELVWPTAVAFARKHGVGEEEAEERINAGREHHQARQKYARALRDFLQSEHRQGLDTPMLVGAEIARGKRNVLPAKLVKLWHEARDIERPGMAEREPRVVRVCDYKIRRVEEWLKTLPPPRGALVWVWNIEVGRWAFEILRESLGERVLHAPEEADRLMESAPASAIIVASIGAHGEAKNLQRFSEQVFLQAPRAAHVMEQAIGRTHRPGQEADELVVRTVNSTEFDHKCYAACLVDALFAHETDHPQKVIYADYVTLPRYFPSSFLAANGFQVKQLSDAQEKMLKDRSS